jgi:hypothetical protein
MQSNLTKFRIEFTDKIMATNPESIGPEIPIRPIYRPDVEQSSGLHDSTMKPIGESPILRDTMVSAD